jgi:catechol-2,3-dioxygenase
MDRWRLLNPEFITYNPGVATSEHHPIDPAVRIGHVHLKVSDLNRSLAFYSGILGFEITQRMGNSAGFILAGGYHHHHNVKGQFEVKRGRRENGKHG